jgi:predicted GH43/DUF377 family glycosyl hydrolase
MLYLQRLGAIMSPRTGDLGTFARFNPGVYWDGRVMHVLYRASDSAIADKSKYVTTIGYASLRLDGTVLNDLNEAVIRPEVPEERMGCEDARIVRLDRQLLVFYTAYDGKTTRVAVSRTEDFRTFSRLGIIDSGFRDKDAFCFPERIGGKVAYVHRVEPGIQIEFVARLEDLFDESHWRDYQSKVSDRTIMGPEQEWEAAKIGGGAPPVRTDAGWLLVYHGVSEERRYCAGAALLDLRDPRRVIARLPYPILEPEMAYERVGDVPNVVFPEGAFVHGGELYVVYGAADSHIAAASIDLGELLDELMRHQTRDSTT